MPPEATGFSAKTISRLKGQWAEEYDDWRKTDLSHDEWVYVWADGICSGLRLTDDRLCALVAIGVNPRGEKQFTAIEEGIRKSTQSWREVLLCLMSRGLAIPKLATGDGAMWFWATLEEVFPTTRQQRCRPPGGIAVQLACRVIDAQNWQRAQLPSRTDPAQSQENAA